MTSEEDAIPAWLRGSERYAVSVIVPTRNEADNVRVVTERLLEGMAAIGAPWELLFVDDSDDCTPDRIDDLRREHSFLKLIHRAPGERHGGLSGAVVEGFAAAEGEAMVVMDGDLQHPPEIVPLLAASVLTGACSIAVGSRYVGSPELSGLASPYRRMVSQASRMVVRGVFPSIWRVRDPLSGFFAVGQDVIANTPLAPEGFKILLEVLIRGQWDQVHEVPYEFAERRLQGGVARRHSVRSTCPAA